MQNIDVSNIGELFFFSLKCITAINTLHMICQQILPLINIIETLQINKDWDQTNYFDQLIRL